jgi:hypothetical protein
MVKKHRRDCVRVAKNLVAASIPFEGPLASCVGIVDPEKPVIADLKLLRDDAERMLRRDEALYSVRHRHG